MQTLDVISVNLWQILISLINLVLLFLILKFFLYKPVKKVLAARQAELDEKYSAAETAKQQAAADKAAWEEKLQGAEAEAEAMIQAAAAKAGIRGEKIVAEAKDKADSIIRQAQTEAELERQKAKDDIKREIVSVSTVLTEKMLDREINEQDHRTLIESFIEKIGDDDDGNE
ncbi:MAG: F0F1 ATP synthase subunit B [Ruminococcaceae bacterium]|nr:F0F1 ATP synthase subunit B [Oscillospiraceae bacterium]